MFRHIGLSVKAEERALRLYRDILGFEFISSTTVDPNFAKKILGIINLNIVKIKKDDLLLELYIMPKDYNRSTWSHIAFTVDNIANLHRNLVANGIKCLSAPVTDESGQNKLLFFRDPDGNLLEAIEPLGVCKEVEVKRELRKSVRPRADRAKPARQTTKRKGPTNPSPFNRKQTKTISEAELNKENKEIVVVE